jgi:protein transport protein SEC61 subunit gamma-like protein
MIMQSIKDFLLKCSRVWSVMRKPTKEEIKTISIASGLGILVIGALGFVVSVIIRLSGIFA